MADSQTEGLDPQEQKFEEEALKNSEASEVKTRVIEKYGLDEVDHAGLIEDLVKQELDFNHKLSTAIRQKISWRDKAKANAVPATPTKQEIDAEALMTKAEQRVREEFEKRDLDSLELPDELKKEVVKLTKTGLSVRQAASDPYITYLKGQYEEKQKQDEAAISRTKQSPSASKKFTQKPPEVDPSTPEGRKELDDWLKWMEKQA